MQKKHKKRKLNKQGKIFLVFVFFSILVLFFLLLTLRKPVHEVHEIVEKKYYHSKINYPVVAIKDIDKEIKTFVEQHKKEFLKNVEETKKIEDDFQYEFLVQYDTHEDQNIKSIHLIVETYTGGAHYTREDKTITYLKDSHKKITIEDLLETKEKFSKLATLSYYYVMELGQKEEQPYDEAFVKEGTQANLKNYEHFYLDEEGLHLLFPPYQVSSWSDGEIKILLTYEEINPLLKKEYRSENKREEEAIPSITPEKRDLSKYQGKKLLAFTFDDGPGYGTTELLLDGVKERDAKVSFFVLGSRVHQYQAVLKRAYQEGHTIGSHTYNHKNLLLLNDFEILHEIGDTNIAIKKVIGVEPIFLRPPYGNTNAEIKALMPMTTILWDVDTEDWKSHDKNKIANAIVTSAHDGAIILLHDIYRSSVEGALLAMDQLKDEYAFVSLEEMIELKKVTIDPSKSYYEF